MATVPPVKNLLPLFVGSIINYTCSNANKVAQWAIPSCSRPLLATVNGARDGSSNWLAVTPHPLQCSTTWVPLAQWNASNLSQQPRPGINPREPVPLTLEATAIAYAATQATHFRPHHIPPIHFVYHIPFIFSIRCHLRSQVLQTIIF